MGGKGQRRREKNYRAAHGGVGRLPPPPKSTDLDAIPSKLRKIIQFTSTGSPDLPIDAKLKKKKGDVACNQKTKRNHASGPQALKFEEDVNDEKMTASKLESDRDYSASTTEHDKKNVKKKKKKRKAVTDLRFDDSLQDLSTAGLSRQKRKKRFLDEKKKQKKVKAETPDFPRHEKIKFGEVVEAPPKLNFPKRSAKSVQDASQERLRLRAIEAYRSHKGWASRPGLRVLSITPDHSS